MDRKKRRHWHWLGILGAVLVPALATAALVVPNTFTASTVIKSADVNANFAAVVTHANGVDSAIAALQAAAPIAFARVAGTTVTGVGGLGTTSAVVAGTGYPYTITFTGNYPAAIAATKVIVNATAESANSGVVNASISSATTTSIVVSVFVWKSDVTTGGLANNPVFVTLNLGK